MDEQGQISRRPTNRDHTVIQVAAALVMAIALVGCRGGGAADPTGAAGGAATFGWFDLALGLACGGLPLLVVILGTLVVLARRRAVAHSFGLVERADAWLQESYLGKIPAKARDVIGRPAVVPEPVEAPTESPASDDDEDVKPIEETAEERKKREKDEKKREKEAKKRAEKAKKNDPAEHARVLAAALDRVGILTCTKIIPLEYLLTTAAPMLVADWVRVGPWVRENGRDTQSDRYQSRRAPFEYRHAEWVALVAWLWLTKRREDGDVCFDAGTTADLDMLVSEYGDEHDVLARMWKLYAVDEGRLVPLIRMWELEELVLGHRPGLTTRLVRWW
jgi:hypothetical protein